jgi:hypothetical protein
MVDVVWQDTTDINLSVIVCVKKTTCVLGSKLEGPTTSLSYHHSVHLVCMSCWLNGNERARGGGKEKSCRRIKESVCFFILLFNKRKEAEYTTIEFYCR